MANHSLCLLVSLFLSFLLSLSRFLFLLDAEWKGPSGVTSEATHSTAVRITVTMYTTMTKQNELCKGFGFIFPDDGSDDGFILCKTAVRDRRAIGKTRCLTTRNTTTTEEIHGFKCTVTSTGAGGTPDDVGENVLVDTEGCNRETRCHMTRNTSSVFLASLSLPLSLSFSLSRFLSLFLSLSSPLQLSLALSCSFFSFSFSVLRSADLFVRPLECEHTHRDVLLSGTLSFFAHVEPH